MNCLKLFSIIFLLRSSLAQWCYNFVSSKKRKTFFEFKHTVGLDLTKEASQK